MKPPDRWELPTPEDRSQVPAPARAAPLGWTRRRWVYAIAASVVVQLALLFCLGQRGHRLPQPQRFGATFHLAADPWTLERLATLPTLRDPTLFALPNRQGFSGGAWLSFAPLQHRPADWTEPPRWLEPDPQDFGRAFAALLATNLPAPRRVADQPLPRLIGADAPAPTVPLPRRSELRLEGDLAGRRLLNPPPALPLQPHSELLSNSVVQALVEADGRVLSATLLVSGGLAAADHDALRFAADARFEPLPPGSAAAQAPAAAKMVFRWHTVPPTATNGPAASP